MIVFEEKDEKKYIQAMKKSTGFKVKSKVHKFNDIEVFLKTLFFQLNFFLKNHSLNLKIIY